MHPLELENKEFEGENSAYLIDGGDETMLVDTGVSTPDVRVQLERELASNGCEPRDLDRILLTHWHQDHAGLAGELQAESGATVHVHEADAPMVRRNAGVESLLREKERARYESWGVPAGKDAELFEFLDSAAGKEERPPTDLVEFSDGDRFSVGDYTLRVVHTPGHTAGLSCFAFEGDTGPEAFVGDTILPVYTPNVGGADPRVDRPLERYLSSLDVLRELDLVRAWPGHRRPIGTPDERIRTIEHHHRERTERVVDVLETHGPADAWTVSAHLFGELHAIHILHGPGEAFAHLDHLDRHGVVEREDGEYALVEAPASLDDLF
ncbi:MBL fold metallo-hydrolase [Salinirarus marinus]|uniref:MBL fold metallo-hydrolase n=1 Tax=Salinirarus marinus TaxID=3068310 RepID=UPI003C6C254D